MLQTLSLSRDHFHDDATMLAGLDDIAQLAFITKEFGRLETTFSNHDYAYREMWRDAWSDVRDLTEIASQLLKIILSTQSDENKATALTKVRKQSVDSLESLSSSTGHLEVIERDLYEGSGAEGNAIRSLTQRLEMLISLWKSGRQP